MMVDILSQDEGEPASYPTVADGLSLEAALIEPAIVWRRLEDWITARWGERTVVWTVQGPGTFSPPLGPATITAREVWNGSAWEAVTLEPTPLGEELHARVYKITATVGSTDTPPETVLEAYRRLAAYMAEANADPARGHTSVSDGDFSFSRPASWAARALHLSGAADLLRSFR